MKKFKINSPCSQDWNIMKIGIDSRHCINCNKAVIDFTKKNRKEISNYLIENKDKNICGRFTENQLDFNIKYDELIISCNPRNHYFIRNITLFTLTIGSILSFYSCDNNIKKENSNTEKVYSTESYNYTSKHEKEKSCITTIQDTTNYEIPIIMGDVISEYATDTEPYHIVDVEPEYKGGQKKLIAYFKKKILSDSIKGRAYVRFVVDKKGKIKDLKIRSNFNSTILEKKIEDILYNMPAWKPGKKDGKIVDATVTLPMIFQ